MTQRTARAWFNPALKPVGFYIESDPNTSIHLVTTSQGQFISLQVLQGQFWGVCFNLEAPELTQQSAAGSQADARTQRSRSLLPPHRSEGNHRQPSARGHPAIVRLPPSGTKTRKL